MRTCRWRRVITELSNLETAGESITEGARPRETPNLNVYHAFEGERANFAAKPAVPPPPPGLQQSLLVHLRKHGKREVQRGGFRQYEAAPVAVEARQGAAAPACVSVSGRLCTRLGIELCRFFS